LGSIFAIASIPYTYFDIWKVISAPLDARNPTVPTKFSNKAIIIEIIPEYNILPSNKFRLELPPQGSSTLTPHSEPQKG
jgi:hypothetical protein